MTPQRQGHSCIVEVVNPDDILILSVNDFWHRSFTSSSDRYPVRVHVPPEFVVDGWNVIVGAYTNVALTGKNDANVEYRVFLDEQEVVHVIYKTEVEPQNFTVHFKDSFSPHYKPEHGSAAGAGRASDRFKDLMTWQKKGQAPPG
jgi:hypothetical protein